MVTTKNNESWEEVVKQTIAQADCQEKTYRKLAVKSMSAWKLLLSLTSESRVLEVGAGVNSQIHNLSDYSQHLFLADNNPSRLAFTQNRQRLEPVANKALLLQCAPDWHLPFADNSLDCVIISREISALFEARGADWQSLTLGLISSRQPVIGLLKEVKRVLKDSGQLVAVWDNLLNHEKLSITHLTSAKQSTRFGYQQMFKAAGFGQLDIHAYQEGNTHLYSLSPIKASSHLLNLPNNPSKKPSLKHKLKRSALLSPALAFIASPVTKPDQVLLENLFADISAKLTQTLGPGQLQLAEHQITRKEKVVISAAWNDLSLIIKMPLDTIAGESEANNVALLNHFAGKHPGSGHFANALCQGAVNNQRYFVESKLPGTPLGQVLKQQGRTAYLEQMLPLLDFLYHRQENNEYHHTELSNDNYQEIVQEPINCIYKANGDQELKQHLDTYFQNSLMGIPVTLGVQHGDFSVNNLLVRDNKINGIIDWETGSTKGLPILDAINYLDSVHRLFNPGILLNQSIPLQAKGDWPVSDEKSFIKQCFKLQDMDLAHYQPLVYLEWLKHIGYLMQYWLRFDSKAQQSFIYDIAKQLP